MKWNVCGEFFPLDFLPIDIIINIFTINKIEYIWNAEDVGEYIKGAPVYLSLWQELL